MSQPNKPISLLDIHDVYSGAAPKKRDTAEAAPSYRKTDRFARDAGHSGTTANRSLLPTGRKTR